MKTNADPAVHAALVDRLEAVTATHARLWGTITAHQMVVHLGDAAEAVLKRRPFPAPSRPPSRLFKWIALRLPLRWPRGIKSGAEPALRVLDAAAFPADRKRAVDTLRELSSASGLLLVETHPIFGPMSAADWQRWAYLHTDHHLRQFGL
jgi:hypothetical protein